MLFIFEGSNLETSAAKTTWIMQPAATKLVMCYPKFRSPLCQLEPLRNDLLKCLLKKCLVIPWTPRSVIKGKSCPYHSKNKSPWIQQLPLDPLVHSCLNWLPNHFKPKFSNKVPGKPRMTQSTRHSDMLFSDWVSILVSVVSILYLCTVCNLI